MSVATRRLLVDADGKAVSQVFDPRKGDFIVLQGADGSLGIQTMRAVWREDFAGAALSPAWTAVVGSGHTITVTGSELQIATGTTVNTETVVTTVEAFPLPLRLSTIFRLSQRIANQEFFIELVNAAGDMVARWRYDGTSATVGGQEVVNAGTPSGFLTATIPTTASDGMAELEAGTKEVYFHGRVVDSVAARSVTAVRHRLLPDPTQSYHIRLRARNLAVAPASSTTFIVGAIIVEPSPELSVEVAAARGQVGLSQAVPVNLLGGTLPTLTTLTTLTTGNIQPIITSWIDSTAALVASGVFTGTSRDLTATRRVIRVAAQAFADQAGTLFIDVSRDNVTWRTPVGNSIALAAGETRRLLAEAVAQWWRVRYVNGATAQDAFELVTAQYAI